MHKKGDIITLATKYNKEIDCEVYNLVSDKNGKYYYSIVRLEEFSYAQRMSNKYKASAELHNRKSWEWYEKSHEGKDFLSLAEPIKIGHHSEKRHRSLIDRNWHRMGNSVKESEMSEIKREKEKYWREKAKDITLSIPVSLSYYKHKLKEAKGHHSELKKDKTKRKHGYSLSYAKKEVNELIKKVELAETLWG